MRTLSEIYSEKRWVAANLKKAGLWCAIGLAITLVSLLLSSHVGFSVITLGAIGWGGWNVYKCMKRLDELKEEEKLVSEHKSSPSYTDTPRTVSTRTSSPVEKKSHQGYVLRRGLNNSIMSILNFKVKCTMMLSKRGNCYND